MCKRTNQLWLLIIIQVSNSDIKSQIEMRTLGNDDTSGFFVFFFLTDSAFAESNVYISHYFTPNENAGLPKIKIVDICRFLPDLIDSESTLIIHHMGLQMVVQ